VIVFQALGKSKSIDKYYLLYDLSLRKSKRIKWDFLEITGILSISTSL